MSEPGPHMIRPGGFAIAAIDNTAFYTVRPRGDADADKLLRRGTSMKVIATAGSYYRVELDSGEVGFVPTVMVEDPNAVLETPADALGLFPGATDVTPVDPTTTLDQPLPPDQLIPPVIEPEIPTTPVPPPTPSSVPPPPPPPPPPVLPADESGAPRPLGGLAIPPTETDED